MRRLWFVLLFSLVAACGVESSFIDAGSASAPEPPGDCAPSNCDTCASCFERCICKGNEPAECLHPCGATGGSPNTNPPPAGGGAPSAGGGGSGGASVGGSGGTPPTPASSCCSATTTPGCSDTSVESCVCAADEYCCTTAWDDICVGEVEGLGCGSCSTGSGGAGAGGSGGSGGTPGAGGGGGFVAGNVDWFTFPEQHTTSQNGWSSYMTDVIRHLPLSYGNTYYDSDKITYVHETTHGINSHLRNYFNTTGKKANAFYVGKNQAVLVVEPKMLKSDANAFVPVSLREFRYSTYLVGASDWNDTPLYLFDEWVAYTNGTEAGVNLVQEGKWNAGWRDASGSLEFTVYAFAVGMAVEQKDPAYFTGYPQFREFLKWNAERAMALYQTTKTMPEFAWDKMDSYYAKMKTSADATAWRGFVKKTYGDAWALSVMGF
jgi:hypothetical protein